MAWKRRGGKLNLRTASIASLTANLNDARKRLGDTESELSELRLQVNSAPIQLSEIQRRLGIIDQELARLRQIRQPSKGILSKIFGVTEIPESVRSQIQEFESKRSDLASSASKLEHLSSTISFKQQRIERLHSWINTLEEVTQRKERKKGRLIELKAAAASNTRENRQVGASIRRQLSKQPYCPYCGGSLGTDPHTDHIYPVSKGGRSVPRNMVWACSGCNTKKSNLTLAAFIKQFSLNRSVIEERLEQLGKDY